MKIIILILTLTMSACADYEALSTQWCADKGEVLGYKTHWGFTSVHCNNGEWIMLEDL